MGATVTSDVSAAEPLRAGLGSSEVVEAAVVRSFALTVRVLSRALRQQLLPSVVTTARLMKRAFHLPGHARRLAGSQADGEVAEEPVVRAPVLPPRAGARAPRKAVRARTDDGASVAT